jgi:lipopolysaccharide export system permease protein
LRSFVAPLAPFIMLLLALPAARGLPRRSDGSGALLLALGLGLAFLLCDGFMSALGTTGRVPAAVAALTAPLLFSAVGLLQLHYSEGL